MKYVYGFAVSCLGLLGCSGSDNTATTPGATAGAAGTGAFAQGGDNSAAGQAAVGTGGTGGAVAAGGQAGASVGGGGQAQMEETGETLFLSFCAPCHGADAKGATDPNTGTPMGPDARHPVEDYALWLVRNGSSARMTHEGNYLGPMLPLTEQVLPQDKLEMILAYLSDPTAFPQPTTGEDLYMDYCSSCHAADGSGVPTGRPVTNVERQAVIDDTHNGHHPGEYELAPEFMPQWSNAEISDAELGLIADFIAGL